MVVVKRRGRPPKNPKPRPPIQMQPGRPPSVGPDSPGKRRWRVAYEMAGHRPAPVTMPAINAREITDADLGLAGGEIAQERAERFLRAATAYAEKHGDKAKPIQAVEVEVPDDALSVVPELPFDPVERAILKELRRLTGLPPLAGLAD